MRGFSASAASTSSSTAPMFYRPFVAAARCSCSCGAQPAASARPSQRTLGAAAVRAVSAAAASSSGGGSSSNANRFAFGGQSPLPSSRREKHNQSSSSSSRSRLFSQRVRASQDYYDVLGVKRDADKKAIKQAYRYVCCRLRIEDSRAWRRIRDLPPSLAQPLLFPPPPHPRPPPPPPKKKTQKKKKPSSQLARKFHPDVNKEPGAEDKFKQISNAYEVLSDDQKRPIYDRFGEAGLKGGGPGGFGGGGAGGASDFNNPFDIFEQFFGGGMGGGGGAGGMGGMGGQQQRQRSSRPAPGSDERHDLTLEFGEAVFGCSKEVDVSRLEACEPCSGSGVKAGTSPSRCGTCGGQGQVVQAVRTPLGAFQQVLTCPACEGAGETSTPCSACAGDGRVRRSKRISLRVPPGVDAGSRLRVRGEGSAGRRGGEPGDLYVFVRVREPAGGKARLRREGTTIHSDVDVSYVDAILGTTVLVDTVDGNVDLKVPPGTQPGTTLVMSKRGVPKLGAAAGVRGDHHVHVRVTIPTKVGGEERKLVEQLREATKAAPAAGKKGWL